MTARLVPCLVAAAALALVVAPAAVRAQSDGVDAGRAVAMDRSKGNCLACHTMQGSDVPSNVGPALNHLKALFPNRADLVAVIADEEARNPQTIMPPFGRNHILTKAEIEQVVDYLYTL